MRTTRLKLPGTADAGRRAAAGVALIVAVCVTPPPGVFAHAAVNRTATLAAPGPGSGGGHDDGSRRGRERELRHGQDDGTEAARRHRPATPRPREHRSPSPRPSPTQVGSPAVAPVPPPAHPVSQQSPYHGGASRLAAITGLGGLVVLALLLVLGGRRLARMRSV